MNPYLANDDDVVETNSKIGGTGDYANRRKRNRAFVFAEKGDYSSLGNDFRKRITKQISSMPIADVVNPSMANLHPKAAALLMKPPPLVEPWDAYYFNERFPYDINAVIQSKESKSTAFNESMRATMSKFEVAKSYMEARYLPSKYSIENEQTYKFVQHPKPAPPTVPGANDPPQPIKVYPTKKEQKRMRRQARELLNKEKQDKIALGLIPAPEPRVTMKNVMRVYGSEAVLDPSAMEAKVLESVEKRKLEHDARNLARMLTPQEKKEKMEKKVQLDKESNALEVAVFRVTSLLNPPERAPKWRFKMNAVAKKFKLGGCALMIPGDQVIADSATGLKVGFNIVVVEGGPKGIARFCHVMTKTIGWSQESGDDDDEDEDDDEEEDNNSPNIDINNRIALLSAGEIFKKNRCWLVWRGNVPNSRFQESFRMIEMANADMAKSYLVRKKAGELFDLAKQFDVKTMM